MNWQVTTGGNPIGPLPEEQIVDMLRNGLQVRGIAREDEGKWQDPSTHAPFAAAIIARLGFEQRQRPMNAASAVISQQRPSELLGILMLVVPLLSTGLVWLWVGQMNLFQSPESSLGLLSVITVCVTAALGAAEAGQVGAGSERDISPEGLTRQGPVAWFFALLLIWIVGFPAWLWARHRYGRTSMVVGGILVAIVFAGSVVLVGAGIADTRQRLRDSLHLPGT